MAILHDVIPPFQLFQPSSLDDALQLLDERRGEAWVLAGGMDSFDWLKDRTKRTSVVVDLSQVAELHGIRDANGGFEIGGVVQRRGLEELERRNHVMNGRHVCLPFSSTKCAP